MKNVANQLEKKLKDTEEQEEQRFTYKESDQSDSECSNDSEDHLNNSKKQLKRKLTESNAKISQLEKDLFETKLRLEKAEMERDCLKSFKDDLIESRKSDRSVIKTLSETISQNFLKEGNWTIDPTIAKEENGPEPTVKQEPGDNWYDWYDGRLRSVRVAHPAIPRKDPGSNPGGDRQTYISSAKRLASFVTQATGGAGVNCGNALRKLTTPVPLSHRARP